MPLRFFADKNGLNDKTAELPDAEMRMEYAVIFRYMRNMHRLQLLFTLYRKTEAECFEKNRREKDKTA